jgi:hypothetical protein
VVALIVLQLAAGSCDFAPPAALGVHELWLGAPRTPCTLRELRVEARGQAAVDVPDFYGVLGASSLVGVRWPESGLELGAELFLAEWRFAQNASVKSTELALGGAAAGVLRTFRAGNAIAWAPALRVVFPIANRARPTSAGAIEAALHGAMTAWRWLDLEAHAAAATALTYDDGFDGRGFVSAIAGAGVRPSRAFHAGVGVEVAGGWYGVFDHVLARGAARFRISRHELSIGVLVPLAGPERTDVAFSLTWALRL